MTKNALAYFLSFVSCISMVISPEVSAELAATQFKQEEGSSTPLTGTCEEAVKAMGKACIEDPKATNLPPGLIDSILGAEDALKGTSIDYSTVNSGLASVNEDVANKCNTEAKNCPQVCGSEAQRLQVANPIGSAKALKDGSECKDIGTKLAAQYGAQGQQAAVDAGKGAESAAAAEGTTGDTGSTSPTSSGGGGGLGQMMGPLLAVGAGAGILCLMGTICKKKEKDEDKDGDGDGSSTISAYTPAECASKDDAYQNDACTDIFMNTCRTTPTAKNCDKFVNLYCGLGDGSDSGGGITPSDSTAEGLGSQFCQTAISQRYCSGASTRTTCPSCQNLARMNSPNCVANPAICLPQMTQDDKEAAQAHCPTDPLFSNPLFFVADTESDSSTDDETDNGDGTTEVSTGVAVKNKTGVASTNGSRQAYGVGGSTGVASYGSDTAGQGVGRNIASVQVAPDIAPAIGSGLFSRHSKWVQSRCRGGEVNNCGPRSGSSSSRTAE